MAALKPAAYATRKNPIFMELDGRTFRLWVEGPQPSSVGDAKTAPLMWTIEVDGERQRGWEVDIDETLDGMRGQLREWIVRDPGFKQMLAVGRHGVVVNVGPYEVFVHAEHYGPGGPRVYVLWGGERRSIFGMRGVHAEALAAALASFAQDPTTERRVVEETAGDYGVTRVVLHRTHVAEESVTVTASGDESRVSTAEGVTLDIPIAAVPRFAAALTTSLLRLEED